MAEYLLCHITERWHVYFVYAIYAVLYSSLGL
jgi:hypothetical protein